MDLKLPLAEAIADALKARDEAHQHDRKEARFAERTEYLDLLERELADIWREKGLQDFRDPALSEAVGRVFGAITEPTHQLDFIFNLISIAAVAVYGGSAIAAGYASQLENKALYEQGDIKAPISVIAQLANAEIMTPAEAYTAAKTLGYRSEAFQQIKDAARDYPTYGVLMELWRHKWIERDDYDRAMYHAGYDRAWTSLLAHLKEGPIDLGTAVAAVTQSQITPEVFAELLPTYGIDPVWADVIFKTAGQSPPVEMTLELWNRGLIEEWQVDKIVLESPIKNEYVDVLKKMRHRFPPLEQTTTLMRHGVMTREEGIDAIKKLGYEETLAVKMADYAAQSAHATTKDVSMANVLGLYEEELIDRGTALADITKLGYDAEEAELLVKLGESRRDRRRLSQAVNRVHTRYVTFKASESEVATALDALAVPTTARQSYLETWAIERDISTAHLTRSDLKRAVKLAALTAGEAATRLQAMGYDTADIPIIQVIDGYAATAAVTERDLSRADHVKLFKNGSISENDLRARLTAMGYSATEVADIITIVTFVAPDE